MHARRSRVGAEDPKLDSPAEDEHPGCGAVRGSHSDVVVNLYYLLGSKLKPNRPSGGMGWRARSISIQPTTTVLYVCM